MDLISIFVVNGEWSHLGSEIVTDNATCQGTLFALTSQGYVEGLKPSEMCLVHALASNAHGQ